MKLFHQLILRSVQNVKDAGRKNILENINLEYDLKFYTIKKANKPCTLETQTMSFHSYLKIKKYHQHAPCRLKLNVTTV